MNRSSVYVHNDGTCASDFVRCQYIGNAQTTVLQSTFVLELAPVGTQISGYTLDSRYTRSNRQVLLSEILEGLIGITQTTDP